MQLVSIPVGALSHQLSPKGPQVPRAKGSWVHIPGWQTLEEPVPDSFLPLRSSPGLGWFRNAWQVATSVSTCCNGSQRRSDGAEAGTKLLPKEDTRHTLLALNTLPLPEDSSFRNSNLRELPEPEGGGGGAGRGPVVTSKGLFRGKAGCENKRNF